MLITVTGSVLRTRVLHIFLSIRQAAQCIGRTLSNCSLMPFLMSFVLSALCWKCLLSKQCLLDIQWMPLIRPTQSCRCADMSSLSIDLSIDQRVRACKPSETRHRISGVICIERLFLKKKLSFGNPKRESHIWKRKLNLPFQRSFSYQKKLSKCFALICMCSRWTVTLQIVPCLCVDSPNRTR